MRTRIGNDRNGLQDFEQDLNQTLPEFPKNTLFHLAARGLKQNIVLKILNRVLELDINLFIIRGDGNSHDGDFNYAINLIKFIKEQYNEKFCIGVAGYPNQHPESLSKEADLHYLKAKVEAGASFIITQIILESSSFINFVKDCRNYGINVPIIPLIMPILSYESFIKMTKICSLTGPQSLYNDLISLKDNTKAIQQYGIQLAINIVEDIISNHCSSIFHLCTLNNITVAVELCERISNLIAHKKMIHPLNSK
ncbi:hypothetical protein PV325_004047 [Microctonus aethiopoides]|nr:hypothetical protein PV325_004047 [Microctonus aethiopoides]